MSIGEMISRISLCLCLSANLSQASVGCNALLEAIRTEDSVLKQRKRTPTRESLMEDAGFLDRHVGRVIGDAAVDLGITNVSKPGVRALADKKVSAAVTVASNLASEAYKNAARWGNKDDLEKSIEVKVFANRERIILVIKDEGAQPFNPENDPFRSIKTRSKEENDRIRQTAGRHLGGGVFWNGVIENRFIDYFVDYDSGSRIILSFKWEDAPKITIPFK